MSALSTDSINTVPVPDAGRGSSLTGMASVSKALLLLDSFRDAGAEIGVSELARRAGVPKSTAFRLLSHLEESGYLEHQGGTYRLAWRLFELGNGVTACRRGGLRECAKPHLVDLYTATRATISFAVLEGTDVIYLDKVQGRSSIPTPAAVGDRRPASTTGLGKALLAFSPRDVIQQVIENPLPVATRFSITQPRRLVEQLKQTRRTHLAQDREETQLGLICVASPVLVDGEAVAAVSLSTRTTRLNEQAPLLLRRTAARIAHDLAASRVEADSLPVVTS